MVSQLDNDGCFVCAVAAERSPLDPGAFLIPGGAIDCLAPENVIPGFCYLREGGGWVRHEDHRNDALYLVGSNARYVLKSDEAGQRYSGIGPIPAWLATTPTGNESPGKTEPTNETDPTSCRAWRDTQIAQWEWLRDRHRDEQELGISKTLNDARYSELLNYLQALRDWPASATFPAEVGRPVAPSWLFELAR
ncbi:phage tail assembly chaperone [Achromobacter denitrificans]|uniref:phage tail assembly chaperone n=1 Tax=Achromobacter denitrificans TaxID=32002 RepID=UPI003CD04F9F